MRAIDKKSDCYFVNNSVLVFLMGQNPKCPGYNSENSIEPRRQVKIYLQRVFLPPPLPVLADIPSILSTCLYGVPRDPQSSTLARQ